MALVRYLGHAGFEIAFGGSGASGSRVALFDPWLDPRPRGIERLVPPAVTQDAIRRADFIFLSHEHFDHCDPKDVEAIVARTNALVIAPPETLSLLTVAERNKVSANAGDAFTLSGIDVTVVPAKHPQSDNAVGFVVKAGGQSVYHSGDTYDFYEMSRIAVDLAMLSIGGTYTMDVLNAVKALKMMRAKFVIPMHYNTFSEIRTDVHEFERRVRASTKTVPVVLRVGEKFDL
ncbi:MBL fold metallo-hydrolase [Candidatus Micrarchaeota archaeon]|nr:MBL fold metallo-hydrolase [Candidatus Micrarchaeota archaeon]